MFAAGEDRLIGPRGNGQAPADTAHDGPNPAAFQIGFAILLPLLEREFQAGGEFERHDLVGEGVSDGHTDMLCQPGERACACDGLRCRPDRFFLAEIVGSKTEGVNELLLNEIAC